MIILVFLAIFFFLKIQFKFSIIKKFVKNKEIFTFKKRNLNKWMNLTKQERYNLLKKESFSYLSKRKILLEEIREEYKRITKANSKKK